VVATAISLDDALIKTSDAKDLRRLEGNQSLVKVFFYPMLHNEAV
jgi:hypothetical protein